MNLLELVRQLSLILVVLSALAGSIAILKKRGSQLKWPALYRKTGRLEVLERVVLSPQASMVLVRWDRREILVATYDRGCSVLEEKEMANGASA
jgi:hypothetical protein